MEAEHRPDDTPVDPPGETPGDPTPDLPDASERKSGHPFFTRRAFLSKDTGRWHKHTGGRDRRDDEPAHT